VPAGDDAGRQGAPSTESTASNPIESSMMKQICPSVINQITIVVPSGSGQQKKRIVLASKRKQPASSNQVITELPPCRGPQSPLNLVAVEFVFGRLFKAFRHTSQVAGTRTLAGADTQPTKKYRAPSMKKILAPRYATILTCTLLFANSIYILMMRLSVGNIRQLNHRRKLSNRRSLHKLFRRSSPPRSLLLWE
jgi:hypothetical protein